MYTSAAVHHGFGTVGNHCKAHPLPGMEPAPQMGSPQIRNHLGPWAEASAMHFLPPAPSGLIAADALIKVYGQDGERVYACLRIFEEERGCKLEPGEFIREFVVKKLPEGTRMGFSKLGRRRLWPYPGLTALRPITMDSGEPSQKPESLRDVSFILPDRVEGRGRS